VKKYQIPREIIGIMILRTSFINFGNSDQLLDIISITPIPTHIAPITDRIFINPTQELSLSTRAIISFF